MVVAVAHSLEGGDRDLFFPVPVTLSARVRVPIAVTYWFEGRDRDLFVAVAVAVAVAIAHGIKGLASHVSVPVPVAIDVAVAHELEGLGRKGRDSLCFFAVPIPVTIDVAVAHELEGLGLKGRDSLCFFAVPVAFLRVLGLGLVGAYGRLFVAVLGVLGLGFAGGDCHCFVAVLCVLEGLRLAVGGSLPFFSVAIAGPGLLESFGVATDKFRVRRRLEHLLQRSLDSFGSRPNGYNMPDIPCADFNAGEDDTKNGSVHPTKKFASLLRSVELCLNAVTHNENHVNGLGEGLRIVVRQNRRRFNDDDVRHFSCGSNNTWRTVY